MGTNWITFRLLGLGLAGLMAAGCTSSILLPEHNPSFQAYAPQGHSANISTAHVFSVSSETTPKADAVEPGNLHDLLDIAVQHSPELRSARARVDAAYGRMVQAGLCPNPAFGPHFSQLGERAGPLGEAGFQLTQVIVTANKLGIAKAAAGFGVEAADWQAFSKWYEVVTRVRAAYFELLAALREHDTLRDIVRVSGEVLQTAQTLEKAGAGSRPDVLRAQVELEQNRLKQEVSNHRVEAGRVNLVTALGRPAVNLARIEKNRHELEQTPPEFDWQCLLERMRSSSSELQEARALVAQQDKLLDKAKADVIPNVTFTGIPFYEAPSKEIRGEIIVLAPIPIFDRNQGNIHAAQAELAKAYADERVLELRLTERLTLAFRNYETARKQVETYHKTIVPGARESLKLVEAGYRGGLGDRKYDYTALLQAQQVLFQAQLAQSQALGDLWRAVVDLAGILQQEDLQRGCSARAALLAPS